MTENQTCQLCEKRPAVAGAGICVECSATLPELFTAMTEAIRVFVLALAGAVDTLEFRNAVEQMKKLLEVFPVNVATGSETVRVRMDGLVPDDTLAQLHSDCVIPKAAADELRAMLPPQDGDSAAVTRHVHIEGPSVGPSEIGHKLLEGYRLRGVRMRSSMSSEFEVPARVEVEAAVLRAFGVERDHVSHPAATAADHIRAADLATASELEIAAARGTPPAEPEKIIDYATAHDPDLD